MDRKQSRPAAFAASAAVIAARPSRARRAACARARMCADADAPASAPDALFARLGHVNKNLRVRAAADLARLPARDVVPRLAGMLGLEDTAHRRAAVQTLGMVGPAAVPAVVDALRAGASPTVRASASKALAAVAMYFPADRARFPPDALDALEAALGGDPDPVTKLATVGCLTTLACDALMRNDPSGDPAAADVLTPAAASEADSSNTVLCPGNERAVDLLVTLLSSTNDVALGASLSGALTQVANCGTPERKASIIDCLKKIVDSPAPSSAAGDDDGGDGDGDGDEDAAGFNYVQEMCRNHISQLEGGSP